MTALAEVRGMSHVVLYVADLAVSIAFYTRTLGLRVVDDQSGDAERPHVKALLGDFAVEFFPVAGSAATGATSGNLLSFAVHDIAQAFARCRAEGLVEGDAPGGYGGAQYFSIRDPDGQMIELIAFAGGAPSLGALIAQHLAAAGISP